MLFVLLKRLAFVAFAAFAAEVLMSFNAVAGSSEMVFAFHPFNILQMWGGFYKNNRVHRLNCNNLKIT